MSNMLEQAIADAAALREQAIKNAEQSVIEKYSQQIKEAVDQMLEVDEQSSLDKANETIKEVEDELMQEEEDVMGTTAPATETQDTAHPPAWDSRYDNMVSNFTMMVDSLPTDEDGMIEIDLGDFSMSSEEQKASEGAPEDDTSPSDELNDETPEEEIQNVSDTTDGDVETTDTEDEDISLQEVIELLEEESQEELEESMKVDYDPINDALGVWRHNRSREEYNAEMAQAQDSEEKEEEVEDAEEEQPGMVNELHETIRALTQQNHQMESVLSKLETHLEETLLSNAKLLYQNRTLSDASLNERQKEKIVEAIANAESPKEAKRLHETLKATVGSQKQSAPQSLSESVNRRSNLSAMLNSRQNINESKNSDSPFMEKMQKLAGIKK